MAIKIIGIGIIAAALLTAAGTTFTSQQTQEAKHPVKGRVKWYAEQGKQKKQGEVKLLAPAISYRGSESDLEEFLNYYSVVIVEPVAEKPAILDEENLANEIVTWYKLKVIENLSRNTNTPQSFPVSLLPQEMLPLQPDEILISKIGGSLTVEGVEVTMDGGGFPALAKNKRYLMFLAVEPSGYARVGAGPGGVFAIDEGGKLRPHGGGNGNQVATELKSRFGGSVDGLRSRLSPGQ